MNLSTLRATGEVSAPLSERADAKNFGTTLKLRLSLLITGMLAMVTVAGGIYLVQKARDDIREEARSTLTLTSHFLNAQIDHMRDHWAREGFTEPKLGLHELGDIRHLSIRFYDRGGFLRICSRSSSTSIGGPSQGGGDGQS